MATTAQSIILRVVETLKDTDAVRWTALELVRYLNDGQRAIVEVRPDATATTTSVSLVAGSRQSVPATASRLIQVVRNTSGSKRVIRSTSRLLLDSQMPDWHSHTGSTEIVHSFHDMREPKVFYVYPPAAVGASVELTYSLYPTDVAEPAEGAAVSAVTGVIDLPDHFANALADYVLYRAFSKDAEENAVAGRAAQHSGAFEKAISSELSSATIVAPKV